MSLRVGSLFTGIGGFDLGFERAGFEVRWQAERNPFRRAVLRQRFPGAELHRDVRALAPSKLDRVDLICGGFPCQDLSYAGGGAGIEGRHSGLWREFARIVRALRPSWVVVENVAALRSRGLDVVLGEMAALGFDAEWDCIPASAIGAPHARDRIWIVAYPNDSGRGQQRQPEPAAPQHTAPERGGPLADARCEGLEHRGVGGELRDPSPAAQGQGLQPQRSRDAARAGGEAVADAEGQLHRTGPEPQPATRLRWGRLVHRCRQLGGEWSTEPGVGRVADGVPDRLDRLAGLGDALVPQIPQAIGEEILRWESDH